ncbi:MAG: DUF1284 domain-containing protein [Mesorhizobium sp.]|nr:MAG: DUF1284 domain-containing protein [Mesorhizobium sp.]
MTVRLRPHHLLCLLTYAGKGYSAAFVANFDAIAARLSAGEDILIVSGPDDICAPLLGEAEPHCLRESVTERDRQAAASVGTLLGCSIAENMKLQFHPSLLRTMRDAFSSGRTRGACGGCEWFDLCSSIAASDYGTVALR